MRISTPVLVRLFFSAAFVVSIAVTALLLALLTTAETTAAMPPVMAPLVPQATNTPTPLCNTEQWSLRTPYPTPVGHEACAEFGGALYCFGGSKATHQANKYDPSTGIWSPLADIPEDRDGASAVSDGTYIYIVNGYGNSTYQNSLWRYDPASNSYTTLAPSPLATSLQAAALVDRRIYRIGGWVGGISYTPTVDVYDISAGTWAPTGTAADYPVSVRALWAVAFGGGIYAAGGELSQGFSSKAYRYDPSGNTWDDAAVTDLPAGRSHTLGGLLNGRFILAGGYVNGSLSNSVIAIDLSAPTGSWLDLPGMLATRFLPGGGAVGSEFFVVGGSDPSFNLTNTNQRFGLLPCVTPSSTPLTRTPTFTPTPAGDKAVAFHINEAHTGDLPDASVTPPLAEIWSADLGGQVSYPLVVGNIVYVTAADPSSFNGSHLFALNAESGATVWGPVDLGGSSHWSGIAYDEQKIFALNGDGLLMVFDGQTGAPGWSIQLPGQYSFTSPPTAYGGILYTGGAGSGGTLYAVQESDGTVLWTAPVQNGMGSSPAVSNGRVFVSYSCEQTYGFDALTGHENWHYVTGCAGGGGTTASVYDGKVYARDWSGQYPPVILDAVLGDELGNFTATAPPAFHSNTGYYLDNTVLHAKDLATGSERWSFAGDGTLSSAPVVVAGSVYIGSSAHHLYALDADSGTLEFSTTLPAAVLPPNEFGGSYPTTGLGAGSGTLVVPATNWLVAFGPAPPTPTPTATSTPTATFSPTATLSSTSLPTTTPTNTPGTSRTPVATPSACILMFEDVPPGSTFFSFVRCLSCRGIVQGYPCGGPGEPCNPAGDPYFRPQNNVTRGQLAKIASNAAGFSEPVTGQRFQDVPPGQTFYDFVGRLSARGVVSGYACGGPGEPCVPPASLPYFRPNANVTRGQTTKIVAESAGFTGVPSGQQFEDVPPGSPFYTYVYRLAIRQIMNGYPCGNPEPCVPPANLSYFRPGNSATRGQVSKIVANAFYPDCYTPGR